MAQHIEIRTPKAPKILQKIGASLEKEARGLTPTTTSMRWENVKRLTGRKEDENIYITTRYIGKGIVAADTRGTFEVHVEDKKAKHVFLVA